MRSSIVSCAELLTNCTTIVVIKNPIQRLPKSLQHVKADRCQPMLGTANADTGFSISMHNRVAESLRTSLS